MSKYRKIYYQDGTSAEFVDGVLVDGNVKPKESTTKDGQIQIFKSGLFEHIAQEPIYCGSKADLRAACREHNSYSDYAG